MAGLLLLQYGMAKILGFPAVPQFAEVAVFSLLWFAGMIELVFGALVVLGLYTRFSAFILSGEMAFAYFIGHAGKHFLPILNGGGFAALFCFVFLYIAAAGGGPWSVDRLIERLRGD
jgi:putative oxidoreductase